MARGFNLLRVGVLLAVASVLTAGALALAHDEPGTSPSSPSSADEPQVPHRIAAADRANEGMVAGVDKQSGNLIIDFVAGEPLPEEVDTPAEVEAYLYGPDGYPDDQSSGEDK